MTRFRTGCIGLALAGLVILSVESALVGQERTDPSQPADAPSDPRCGTGILPVNSTGWKPVPQLDEPGNDNAGSDQVDQDESSPTNYGKTPDTAIPYRNFHKPYQRFFQERMAFLGAGRDREPTTMPETVRIGFFGPLGSTPDADLGELMLEGATLAIEEANAAGGYKGIPFKLIVRPDLALWGASSNVMIAFKYEDDVLAVIGAINGANTHIALRVVLKTQMLIVNTGDTDPTLTETNIPWLMRCMADDRQQGYALAHHVFRECGIEKVVALRVNNHYGKMGIAEFRDAARRLRHPLYVELRWERGDRDFAMQLDRIAELNPEAIVLWGNAADSAAIVREIRRREMPVRIFGSDRLAAKAFLEAAGEAAEGVVAAATYDPTRDDPRLSTFRGAFAERFNHPPETFAAHAYDGANLLIAAVRKAGLNRVRIRDAMYEITRYDGVTGPIIFDTTLNDIGPVYLATVKNGRFVYREVDFTSGAQIPDTKTAATGDAGGLSAGTARRASPAAKWDPRRDAGVGGMPYRTLAESAPVARSPDRPTATARTAFRIGCFLPLDEVGQAAVRGVRKAIAEDAARHPEATPIRVLVRDARGAWGGRTDELVDLVFSDEVLVVIGSTERRGTHLAEMLAAKMHFPVLALCGADPTITGIPLPWVFQVARDSRPDEGGALETARPGVLDLDGHAALGHDAAALLAARIREGAHSRRALRDALAAGGWHLGLTGAFRFDPLGNRMDRKADKSDLRTR